MSIYVGNQKAVLYKGDYHPASLYRGANKIAGYKLLEQTGTALAFADTYNDTVQGLAVFGKSQQVTTVQGKNLFDKVKISAGKYLLPTDGSIGNTNYSNHVSAYIPVSTATYTISGHTYVQPAVSVGLAWFTATKVYISGTSYGGATGNGTYTRPSNAAFVRYTLNNIDLNTSQLESGSTATTYAAFVPNSPSPDYPSPIVSVGETNGVTVTATDGADKSASETRSVILRSTPSGVRDQIDGITGEVTRPIEKIIFDGSADELWIKASSPNGVFQLLNNAFSINNGICSHYKLKTVVYLGNMMHGQFMFNPLNPRIYFCNIDCADVTAFRSWLSANPVTVLYQPATPTTETVAPITLPTYPGQTHLDAGGAEMTATCRVVDL